MSTDSQDQCQDKITFEELFEQQTYKFVPVRLQPESAKTSKSQCEFKIETLKPVPKCLIKWLFFKTTLNANEVLHSIKTSIENMSFSHGKELITITPIEFKPTKAKLNITFKTSIPFHNEKREGPPDDSLKEDIVCNIVVTVYSALKNDPDQKITVNFLRCRGDVILFSTVRKLVLSDLHKNHKDCIFEQQ